jgi:3-oxocholest-4-en-26-oyl-CoA dehydrogenase alpha subunit
MHVAWSLEQRALQDRLRAYFAEVVPPELRDRFESEGRGGEAYQGARRKIGADGWLGVSWPAGYGGRGMSALEQCIFREEAERAAAPVPFITVDTVGPALIRYGSELQKQTYLPRIAAGEIEFAIGYTEPSAGSDLAALKTRAVRDGSDYVISGSKVFTTHGAVADYVWLAARTGSERDRHRGVSVFIVPTSAPGFSVTPLDTIGGHRTTATYYDSVRVSADHLVLGENEGWRLITSQLNNERVGVAGFVAQYAVLFDELLAWARASTGAGGQRVIDLPWVQQALAQAHVLLETVRLHNWRLASAADAGTLAPSDASMLKFFGSESVQEVVRLMLEVLGTAGSLRPGSPGAVLQGRVETLFRSGIHYTFGGGTNELQREIVAWQRLGLPRSGR